MNISPVLSILMIFNLRGHIACAPSHENRKILWYFDSFGMHYPKEYENRAEKDGMKVIYNTVPYQHIKRVSRGELHFFLT